jgi:hypothetical protein
MTDSTGSIQSPERLRARAIDALLPFFMDGPDANVKTARIAAEELLDDYKAVTPKEIQLAAQVVAHSWASLACLSSASVVKDHSIEAMLDLQDSALALNALCVKSTRALLARQKERTKTPHMLTPEKIRWDEGTFQLNINQALDKFNEANAKAAACASPPAPPAPPAKTKLPTRFAEPMTPSVLARRARLN